MQNYAVVFSRQKNKNNYQPNQNPKSLRLKIQLEHYGWPMAMLVEDEWFNTFLIAAVYKEWTERNKESVHIQSTQQTITILELSL